ncbi:MAG: hypothetical protein JSW54_04900 [Fidelibacterota bacterium]|nr:MAG: hypothetical protein JSW54_04900 [Candidatus Neomarinimicrobiota bacterium]
MYVHRLHPWITALAIVLAITSCGDDKLTDSDGDNGDSTTGHMVGTWQLTALEVEWFRDIAAPEGSRIDTTYLLYASWDYAQDILGLDAHDADTLLRTLMVGDTVLDTSVVLNAFLLEHMGIALWATFSEDSTYTVTGTYPALRLVPDSCITKLEQPQISDEGKYAVDYLYGTFGIRPGQFAQVLPAFDDGEVTFSNDHQTMTIIYTDRDGHDQRISETGETWEEENRIIHGAAELPVDYSSGAFADQGRPARSGYIMDPDYQHWGGYLTFFALTVQAEIDYLFSSMTIAGDLNGDGTTDSEDAIYYILQNRSTGISRYGAAYASLLSTGGELIDDSDRIFDPLDKEVGGKLTYVIQPVCTPINEIVDFKTTWNKIQ